MALEELGVTPDPAPPSARVVRLLADVDARFDGLLAGGLHTRLPNFAPADYGQVHGVLAALARTSVRGERFLEWGSALGAVAGMAAALGFRSCGIELDAEMAETSRELLAAHGLDVEIVQGSFMPEGHEIPADLDDPDTATLRPGVAAYDLLGRDLDEFAVIYAYPWPDMREAFLDMFDTHAADGALLVTFEGRDGCHVHRRTDGAARDPL